MVRVLLSDDPAANLSGIDINHIQLMSGSNKDPTPVSSCHAAIESAACEVLSSFRCCFM